MLEAENITVKRGDRTILRQLFFQLRAGEVLSVVGPNGSGKSTLLKALTGELAIHRGQIRLRGKALPEHAKDLRALARWRAVLPQENELSFNFPVMDVVMMGRWPHLRGGPSARDYTISEEALEAVDCLSLKERMYQHLSGGERRRVHLARVIAQLHDAMHAKEPALLFLDEPTANLDLKHQYEILDYVERFRNQGGSVFLVLHDLQQALSYSDRVLLLEKGRALACGRPADTLSAARVSRAFGLPVEWVSADGNQFLNVKKH